jgi:hypothetical protein
MSRWVTAKRPGLKAAAGEKPDGPLARIAKYIPGEIVSAYTLLFSGLAAFKLAPGESLRAAFALIAIFLVVTIVYVATRTPRGSVRTAHLIVSPIAFLVWAYPISSSLLGAWFVGLAAFFGQAIIMALSIIIVPIEN